MNQGPFFMPPLSQRPAPRAAAWLVGLVAATVLLTALLRNHLDRRFAADFICWWTAANLLARGEDPYDLELQKQFQYDLGWRKEKEGGNTYGHVAFYHAPWLGLMCLALVPLDYETARAVFVAVNLEALLMSGWLLRRALHHLSAVTVVGVPLLFGFSWYVLAIGQVTGLVLLMLLTAWRLLEANWDRTAGVILAAATIKPQLMVVPLAALVVWAVVRRRWPLLLGLALGFATVFGVSALFIGNWPLRMIEAQRETPLPTDAVSPGLGSTWFLVLKVFGLGGVALWAAYLAVALPAFAWALWAAARRASLLEIFCVSCLATPFVSPYGQPYDFVLMLLPLLYLANRTGEAGTAVLLVAYLVLPYIVFCYGLDSAADHYRFFIVPASLTALWLAQPRITANRSPA